ncbi:MAG: hypothetical protein COW65_02300 [Cytophagales bacterium CG18_big_fil_WC_8_21_14_2_50_42_9]|nr:MAG: hypothetical protein COW65_02300 [Cytophagales bacterium CG18_big_fil_WC_8_21_14_2_50_42_9]
MKIKAIYLIGLIGILILANVQKSQSEEQRISIRTQYQVQASVLSDSLDATTSLVLAPGFTTVKENCLRCHSPKLITAKRASREGWLTTIHWMQQTQGLGDLGSAEPIILDYLAKHYAPNQSGRRPALQNIEWYKLEK